MGRSIPLCAIVSCLAVASARAQEYWTRAEIAERYAEQNRSAEDFQGGGSSGDQRFSGATYPDNYSEVAAFLDRLQVKNPADPQFGGMEEGEHLPGIVETDNTTESIWVWTHYRRWSGDQTYDQNTADAWTYVMNHPAYDEGSGGGSFDYYGVYNCGWALIAEPEYREVTGDSTYLAYAIQCADFLVANPLNEVDLLNRFTEGWAIGALYRFGILQGNQTYVDHAQNRGRTLKRKVESNPSQLGSESWALCGGTLFWGIMNSLYADKPAAGRSFAESHASFLDAYDPSGSWHSAHNGWYAVAQSAAWRAVAGPDFKGGHRFLADHLLSEDGDDDGGIPAEEDDSDSQDQSWVTNYLAFMGLFPVEIDQDTEMAPDAGILTAPGTLGVNMAVGNNLPSDEIAVIFGFLHPPTGAPVLIGPAPVGLVAHSEAGVTDVPFDFPGGSPAGTWSIELFIYGFDGRLQDVDRFEFELQ